MLWSVPDRELGQISSAADNAPCGRPAGGTKSEQSLKRGHRRLAAVVTKGEFVEIDQPTRPQRQVVACVQFSSAAWRMGPRDAWIGWDDATRRRHLPQVVNNSRFLVLPWISVKNLASTVLSRVARAVVPDWRTAYGVTPLLLETLVDPQRFDGTCYRAANWIGVGTTTGRGRNDRHRRVVCAPKRVLVYPLVPAAAPRLRGH